MVNRYTSDRRLRRDDAYSPGGAGGLRPDRAVTVYAQRCREAFGDVPVVIGGIEASLRRIAHYDYWSNKVRRSVLRRSTRRSAGLRQRRARDRRDRAPAGGRRGGRARSPICAAPRSAGARAARRLDRDRLDDDRHARAGRRRSIRTPMAPREARPCAREEPRAGAPAAPAPSARAARQPAAARRPRAHVVRMPDFDAGRRRPGALRARVAHPARRGEPGQRARAGAAPRRSATCG